MTVRPVASLLLAALVLVPASPAPAQTTGTPRWPTDQEVEGARSRRPFPAIDTTPHRAPLPPRIGIGPEAKPGIDIAALARQGGELAAAATVTPSTAQPPALRIFVTLDMPEGSLRRLVDQAERAGAVLVLRGLKNQSMRQTVAAVRELLGQRRAGWVIDPEAFEHHGVEAAPTFLLTTGGDTPPCSATTCTVPRPFVSVSGDVSLDHALAHMARHRPDVATVVGPYLARLRPR
jgi:conjugal transfer pilus assembly protein TrbC